MSPDLERHEIILGSSTLLLNSTCTAFLACYIANGGYSMVYYQMGEYPIWWFLLQFPLIFIYQVGVLTAYSMLWSSFACKIRLIVDSRLISRGRDQRADEYT